MKLAVLNCSFAVFAFVIMSGCDSIFNEKTQKMNVTTSSGEEVEVLIDGMPFDAPGISTVTRAKADKIINREDTKIISVEQAESYLLQGNTSYENGDHEAAKQLYLKATQGGNADAHFALGYKYILPDEENTFHYIEAAKKGHEEALYYALDKLFFRAASLNKANPSLALEVYQQAKKSNPSLKIYHEYSSLKTIQRCVEPGEFDVEAFTKKYNFTSEEDGSHGVWNLAEEASIGGRFGKPDPKLVFNLVCRGGFVPAELESAVEETYSNWKNGSVKEFKVCDHVSSGVGAGFCASRQNDADEKARTRKLQELGKNLDEQSKNLLANAYKSAEIYIEMKAGTEEGHGGSGRAAWIIHSEIQQKNAYLQTIEKVRTGYVPTPKQTFIDADKKLNETYQAVLKNLDQIKSGDDYVSGQPSSDDVKAVQRLWITYRDNSVKLFSQINSSVDENVYKSWLTEIREGILEFYG